MGCSLRCRPDPSSRCESGRTGYERLMPRWSEGFNIDTFLRLNSETELERSLTASAGLHTYTEDP